mgnify:CR=1 FL=1
MSDTTQITVFPLAGWTLATLPKQAVLVDLQLIPLEGSAAGQRRSLPVGMSAEQAEQLAEDLRQAAAATRMGPAPSPVRS